MIGEAGGDNAKSSLPLDSSLTDAWFPPGTIDATDTHKIVRESEMIDGQTTDAAVDTTTPPILVRVFAGLMSALILLQAFLGGRGFFVNADLLKIHRMIGITTLAVTVIQLIIVFMMMKAGKLRSMLLGMSGAIFVLTLIQLMLGFSAKNGSGEAAAWHIFTGVFLTGAIAAYANTVFRTRESSRGF